MIRGIALAHGDDPALRTHLSSHQRATLDAIATCGTAAAGVHLEACDACGDRRYVPNTCGNRCCPHCQGHARRAWVAAREGELLPCCYFHAVLTLPPELRGLARAFPRVVLGCLITAAGQAIDRCCRQPRLLGATVGQLAVLHTWRRDLHWHPHVHVIVTAGGLTPTGRWITARRYGRQRRAFLVPVAVLRAAFQQRLRRLLLRAFDTGAFEDGPTAAFPVLARRALFERHLFAIARRPWVIRIEPPFGGPRQLLRYLGAYVNRVAISPQRVTAHDAAAGTVTYTWATNAQPKRPQQATLSAVEFLARFAQHILPARFQRIRFRGLWATAHRRDGLHRAQELAARARPATPPSVPAPPDDAVVDPDAHATPCLCCHRGHYRRLPGTATRPPPAQRHLALQALRQERRHTPAEDTRCA
jgi:hypothetical protein